MQMKKAATFQMNVTAFFSMSGTSERSSRHNRTAVYYYDFQEQNIMFVLCFAITGLFLRNQSPTEQQCPLTVV